MEYIAKQLFEKNISEGSLENLNRLLVSEKLEMDDKVKAFSIATFLMDDDQAEKTYLDGFVNFCLSDKVNDGILSKYLFRVLLAKVDCKIDAEINEEGQRLLREKIYTSSVVGINNLEVFEEGFFLALIKILFSNADEVTCFFIRELFKNDIMKRHTKKRDIILRMLLSGKLTGINLAYDGYSSVFDIITDESVLKLDNNSYEKIVNMAFKANEKEGCLLVAVMQDKRLSLSKKASALDYVWKIKKYLDKYSDDSLRMALKQSETEVNLFNVVYCDKLVLMQDSDYETALKKLGESNKPLSYVKVLASVNISEEQRELALSLINRGSDVGNSYSKYSREDYKNDVALAAISPVLVNMPMQIYKEILIKIDNWCEMLNEIYLKRKVDDRIDFGAVKACVVYLLGCSELYGQNPSKLLIAIDYLTSVKDSRRLINKVFKFCSNSMASYYSDVEYKRILDLIKDNVERDMSGVMIRLFTNANVPFMEDKALLFEMAMTGDKNSIEDLTNKLNIQGNYTMNMRRIFNGVDENTVKVIGPSIKRIKIK